MRFADGISCESRDKHNPNPTAYYRPADSSIVPLLSSVLARPNNLDDMPIQLRELNGGFALVFFDARRMQR